MLRKLPKCILIQLISNLKKFYIKKKLQKSIHPKVYRPLILLAKKRYVGLKYETLNSVPVLEGKGIEIVRRDGCDATAKIMTKCLNTLFETSDLSAV